MGPLAGILLLVVLPVAVLDQVFASGGAVLRLVGGLLLSGGVLALILPRWTVSACLGGILGSLAAAVVAVVDAQSALFLPLLVLGAGFGAVFALALYRLRRKAAPAAPSTTPHDL